VSRIISWSNANLMIISSEGPPVKIFKSFFEKNHFIYSQENIVV